MKTITWKDQRNSNQLIIESKENGVTTFDQDDFVVLEGYYEGTKHTCKVYEVLDVYDLDIAKAINAHGEIVSITPEYTRPATLLEKEEYLQAISPTLRAEVKAAWNNEEDLEAIEKYKYKTS